MNRLADHLEAGRNAPPPAKWVHVGTERECKTCGGAGFVRKNVPLGDPDFGKVFACPKCQQGPPTEAEILRSCGIPSSYGHMTLESFSGKSLLLDAARKFARDGQYRHLIMCGLFGTGKTHLAVALARLLTGRGEAWHFVVVPALLDDLRRKQQANEGEYWAYLDFLNDVPGLVLDDLGAQKVTEWAEERLYMLVDGRYSQAKRTIVTSNVIPEEWGGRIASRLCDRRVALVEQAVAGDFRNDGAL